MDGSSSRPIPTSPAISRRCAARTISTSKSSARFPSGLQRRLLSQRPKPAVRAARRLPLVLRRRHDPRLLRRGRQGPLSQPLCPHAEVGARARGGQGAVRRLRSARGRSVGGRQGRRRRQHQHRLARRPAAGARRSAPPFELDPETLESRGYVDGLPRPRHRPSQDRSEDRRDGLVRLWRRRDAVLAAPCPMASPTPTARSMRRDDFEAPFSSMVHDFLVTDRHALFPILPLTGILQRAMRGGPPSPGSPTRAPMSASWRATPASTPCAGSPPTPATSSIR